MFRHPQDDILYIGVANVIATLDNSTFTAAAFTLPTNLTITSFEDYGVYLSIACAPKDQGNKSWCYLWGRDTSIATVDESIDWEEGALMVVGNVGGTLIGIKAQTQGAATTLDIAPKITISAFQGGTPRVVKEIQWTGTGTPSTILYNYKDKKDGYLYFAAKQYVEGRTVCQLWVVGRNKAGGFFVAPDRLVNNDTEITSVDAFSILGDYAWVAYNNDGSLKRTSSTATYTATSIWEKKYTLGDSRTTKETKGASVMFEPLESGQSVSLKYKKNNETSFTTVFTATSSNQDSSFHKSAVTPTGDWNEITFRIESTGGATPTGFRMLPELKANDIY